VDANLRWSATPQLTVALAVDNLFDAAYEDAIGFPAPGLRPRLGVNYRFEEAMRVRRPHAQAEELAAALARSLGRSGGSAGRHSRRRQHQNA
jgi:hypothetical protein